MLEESQGVDEGGHVAYRETPHGRLYRPRGHWAQAGVLLVCFVATLSSGSGVAPLLGDLSDVAVAAVTLPAVGVFFGGYALWIARLNALAYQLLGRALFKTLFRLIVLRRLPEDRADVLPSPEQLEKAAVLAQRAGASFVPAGFVMVPVAMVVAVAIDASSGVVVRATIVGSLPLAWGYALGYLGRRGYLPFLEEA